MCSSGFFKKYNINKFVNNPAIATVMTMPVFTSSGWRQRWKASYRMPRDRRIRRMPLSRATKISTRWYPYVLVYVDGRSEIFKANQLRQSENASMSIWAASLNKARLLAITPPITSMLRTRRVSRMDSFSLCLIEIGSIFMNLSFVKKHLSRDLRHYGVEI